VRSSSHGGKLACNDATLELAVQGQGVQGYLMRTGSETNESHRNVVSHARSRNTKRLNQEKK